MRLLPKPEDQGYLPHPSLNLCLRIEFSMKIFPNKNTLLRVLNRIDIFECKETQMLRCFHSRLKKCELKLKRGNLFKFGISNDTRRGSGNEETVQEMNNLGASVTRYWCKKQPIFQNVNLKHDSVLVVMGDDSCQEVLGSNPAAVYWMDIFHILL